jgi:isoleucyl-tRNA synthetase
MSVLSAILFDEITFENVVTTGTILAEDGQKMSKSKNNFPDPMKIVDKYGADALRFYLMGSGVMNADNMNFSEKGVDETYKKVLVLLYNVNNFYKLYQISEEGSNNSKKIIDKWVLLRLNQTIEKVEKYLKEYNTIKACAEFENLLRIYLLGMLEEIETDLMKEKLKRLKHLKLF